MRFAPTWGTVKDAGTPPPDTTSTALIPYVQRPMSTLRPERRVVQAPLEQVTWVFAAVNAICRNAARLPAVTRRDDPIAGEQIDHYLLPILNGRPNPNETAVIWKWRLFAQYLLSRRGTFVEIVRDRGGQISSLHHLPLDHTRAIPHPTQFVSHYEVNIPGQALIRLDPDRVLWVRGPHPTNPYLSLTPLESSGLAIDTDFLARVYNRHFLDNDARPGITLVVRDELDDDAADKIKARYEGPRGSGPEGAGRVAVIEAAGGIDVIDTAVSPRDAQYVETRRLTKEEILAAFGVPESLTGNASQRTFNNVDAEGEIFWQETMLGHLETVGSALDMLDGEPDLYLRFSTESVRQLKRHEIERQKQHLDEVRTRVRTRNEYRAAWGLDPHPEGDTLDPQLPDIAADKAIRSRHAEAKQVSYELRLAAWERTWTVQMRRFFARQGEQVEFKLRGRRAKSRWSQKHLAAEDLFERDRWNKQLAEDVISLQMGVALDFGPAVAATLRSAFNETDPLLLAALDRRRNLLSAVNDTTFEAIRAELKAGLAAGETADVLAARLKMLFYQFGDIRALTVAQTEVNWAANMSQLSAARQSGVVAKKIWLAAQDERVRANHREANGQAVPLDMPFTVGGELIDHPGEGSAGNAVRCRCTMLFDTGTHR